VCPIALLVDDLATAEHYVGTLLDHSTRHALTYYRAFGACHQGALAIKRGDVMTGSRLLRASFNDDFTSGLRFVVLLMTAVLGHAGEYWEGFAELIEAIEQPEQTEERWLIAELLRIKGERLLLQNTQGAVTEAEGQFRQSLGGNSMLFDKPPVGARCGASISAISMSKAHPLTLIG
jgi:hypothetical protein